MSSGTGEGTLALGGDLGAHTSFAGEEEFFTEEVETARHLLVLPLGRDGVCHLRTEGEQSRSFSSSCAGARPLAGSTVTKTGNSIVGHESRQVS